MSRRQALAVAIASVFGSIVVLGWLVSDHGEDSADGAMPVGASETRSVASSAGGDGRISMSAATVKIIGFKGKSAPRILAKATSPKIETAPSDGKGWAGGLFRVEAESSSCVVTGEVDRNKGETAPSEKDIEYFVEAPLKVRNADSGDVPSYDVDFVLVNPERGLVSSPKGDEDLNEGITLRGGEKTTVKLCFKVNKDLQEVRFFSETSDSSGMVFYEVGESVTLG